MNSIEVTSQDADSIAIGASGEILTDDIVRVLSSAGVSSTRNTVCTTVIEFGTTFHRGA
jgi:hypothetical protein